MGLKDAIGPAKRLISALDFHISNAFDNMQTAPITRVTHTADILKRIFDLCVDLSQYVIGPRRFRSHFDIVLRKAAAESSVIPEIEWDDDMVFIHGEFDIKVLHELLLIKTPTAQIDMEQLSHGKQDSTNT
jgi:hypothetical protein